MIDAPASRPSLSADVQAQILQLAASWRPQSIADHLGVPLAEVQPIVDRAKAKPKGRR